MCTGQGIDLKKQRERQAHHGNPRNGQLYSEACLKALCCGCDSAALLKDESYEARFNQNASGTAWDRLNLGLN